MDKVRLREFIAQVRNFTKVKSEGLLEKDFNLTILLNELKTEDFVFKGGTCLSKVYLDYHRLSEDIDLTWKDQGMFEGKSTKQIKKICSKKINDFGAMLEDIAKRYGFDFKLEKGNRRYVEIGSNNKLVTFKIWYKSIFTNEDSFIKIQINFLEKVEFDYVRHVLKPTIDAGAFEKEERIYFEDFLRFYGNKISYYVYDYREIVCEKIRALLTRREIKTRDVVDLYFIEKMLGLRLDVLKDKCTSKVVFAVQNYRKYKDNFKSITKQKLTTGDLMGEDVAFLLLRELNKKELEEFVERLVIFLDSLVVNIKKSSRT